MQFINEQASSHLHWWVFGSFDCALPQPLFQMKVESITYQPKNYQTTNYQLLTTTMKFVSHGNKTSTAASRRLDGFNNENIGKNHHPHNKESGQANQAKSPPDVAKPTTTYSTYVSEQDTSYKKRAILILPRTEYTPENHHHETEPICAQ